MQTAPPAAPTVTPDAIFQLATGFMAAKTSLLTFWNRLSYPAWNGLGDAVRSDGKPSSALFELPREDSAIFSAGVEAASAGGAMALAASYDFARHTRVLDIGGGTGSFLKFIRVSIRRSRAR